VPLQAERPDRHLLGQRRRAVAGAVAQPGRFGFDEECADNAGHRLAAACGGAAGLCYGAGYSAAALSEKVAVWALGLQRHACAAREAACRSLSRGMARTCPSLGAIVSERAAQAEARAQAERPMARAVQLEAPPLSAEAAAASSVGGVGAPAGWAGAARAPPIPEGWRPSEWPPAVRGAHPWADEAWTRAEHHRCDEQRAAKAKKAKKGKKGRKGKAEADTEEAAGKLLPLSALNDGVCDCADGSDEPGTTVRPKKSTHRMTPARNQI
jgi:hypothetical protein